MPDALAPGSLRPERLPQELRIEAFAAAFAHGIAIQRRRVDARQRGLDERSARGLIIEGMASALLARAFGDPLFIESLDLAGLLRQAVAQHLSDDPTAPTTPQEAAHG